MNIIEILKSGNSIWNEWIKSNGPVSLQGEDLKGINLSFSNQPEGLIVKINLKDVNFSNSDLRGTRFDGALIENSIFDGADLSQTSFRKASLKNCSFKNAKLTGSSFHRGFVEKCDFTDADLSFVDLTPHTLGNTKLNNSKITGVNLQKKYFGSPWDVNPFNLLEVVDLHLVNENDHPRVIDYLKERLEELYNDVKNDRESEDAYQMILKRANSLFQIFIEKSIPSTLIEVAQKINAELIEFLKRNPKHLHNIHWRAFEELIAELLASFGWYVELTSPTKDNGYDIFAVYSDSSGIRHNWIVECKKYSEKNTVGIDIVRSLYGVKTDLKVGNALLATTSSLTNGVHEFKKSHYDFDAKGFNDIVDWLNQYKVKTDSSLYIKENRLELLPEPWQSKK